MGTFCISCAFSEDNLRDYFECNYKYNYDLMDKWEQADVDEFINEWDGWTYDYYLEINMEDIKEFLFKEKFNKDYESLSYYLEPGAKELIKDFENKWWQNKIDTLSFQINPNFLEFLKEKYSLEIIKDLVEKEY